MALAENIVADAENIITDEENQTKFAAGILTI